MDREFQEYRQFCRNKGFKECRFDSLVNYFKQKHQKDIPDVKVVLPMSANDRIKAIEDYYLWADKNQLGVDFCSTFLTYKQYLFRDIRRNYGTNDK